MLPSRQNQPKIPPFLSWLFQLTVHEKGTCLSRSSDGKFQHKSRDSQDDQTQKIDQHKAAAAILAAHPGEFPDVAAADGAPRRQHDKAQAAAQAFAFVHKSVSLSVVISAQTISVRPWVRNL